MDMRRTARGELVDYELIKIRAALASQPIKPVTVRVNNQFIDNGTIPKVIYNQNKLSKNSTATVDKTETVVDNTSSEKRKGKQTNETNTTRE